MLTLPDHWARWWLWLWGAVAVGLLGGLFFLPFKYWAVCAAVGFGTMEGIGLRKPHDPYPPLTHVIHRFVPRWAAFTAIYGFVGEAGGLWFKFGRPVRLAAIFALLGWLTTHFDTTFDETKTLEEREKYQGYADLARRVMPGGKTKAS